jgi:hypothetical protein
LRLTWPTAAPPFAAAAVDIWVRAPTCTPRPNKPAPGVSSSRPSGFHCPTPDTPFPSPQGTKPAPAHGPALLTWLPGHGRKRARLAPLPVGPLGPAALGFQLDVGIVFRAGPPAAPVQPHDLRQLSKALIAGHYMGIAQVPAWLPVDEHGSIQGQAEVVATTVGTNRRDTRS